MEPGDDVWVDLVGERCAARVIRLLDRHGRPLDRVDLAAPPPFTTVVLALAACPGEHLCVPLWLPDPDIRIEARRAA
jgi:hypothetical protein